MQSITASDYLHVILESAPFYVNAELQDRLREQRYTPDLWDMCVLRGSCFFMTRINDTSMLCLVHSQSPSDPFTASAPLRDL